MSSSYSRVTGVGPDRLVPTSPQEAPVTLRQRASRIPAARRTTPLLLVAALSLTACGSSDEPGGSAADGSGAAGSEGSTTSLEEAADAVDGTLGIAVEQIGKRLDASDLTLDGTTLTFVFGADPQADGSASPDQTALGACQIARTVLDSVAPEEVETLQMAYPSRTVDCAEYR